MFKVNKSELLHGDITRNLMRITFPLIFLSLINIFYDAVDTFFVSKISPLEVGAISMVSPISSCANAFAEGLCVSAVALIALSIASNDQDRTRNLVGHYLKVCTFLGVLFCVVINVFKQPILIWLETPSEIYEKCQTYLTGISFNFLPYFLLAIYQSIMQGLGDSRSGVVINTIAAILNCILDPIFILVLNKGILGAALATVLSKVLVLPLVIYSLYHNDLIVLSKERLNVNTLKEMFTLALPGSLGSFLSAFGFVLFNKLIAGYGAIAISAYGYGGKISNIYGILTNNWGSALATLVGASLGSQQPERAREAYKKAMKIVVTASTFIIPFGIFTCRYVIGLYLSDMTTQLFELTHQYACYAITTAITMGWMNCLNGVFNGSGNTALSMIMNTCRLWLFRLPLIIILNKITNFGVVNIWLSMVLSNIFVCILGQIIYSLYPWQNKSIKLVN